MSKILEFGNKLEGILRSHLSCDYTEFGVKSNDKLTKLDWKSPINFALGYKYTQSKRAADVKNEIDYFLGDVLVGDSIEDGITRYEYYGFSDEHEAYKAVENIIDNVEKILRM